jgi:transposase InsO family protein
MLAARVFAFHAARETFRRILIRVDRYCADFLLWHNRDRPHGSWDGRTPDAVFFSRHVQSRLLGRVAYFDGRLLWYRFG